jgi:hypothetical protein
MRPASSKLRKHFVRQRVRVALLPFWFQFRVQRSLEGLCHRVWSCSFLGHGPALEITRKYRVFGWRRSGGQLLVRALTRGCQFRPPVSSGLTPDCACGYPQSFS